MAFSVTDKTSYNLLVDDDGSGNTGTVWSKASVNAVYQAVDGVFANTSGLNIAGPLVANGALTGNGAFTANGLITGTSAGLLCNGAFKANTSGVWERGLAVAMGEWQNVAFNAANFTASASMTWTLQAGDQVVYSWTRIGKTLLLAFYLIATTVGGTPSTDLLLAIPGGFASWTQINATYFYSDNGGARTAGSLQINSGATNLRMLKADFSNWTASANNTYLEGFCAIPIA